MLPSTMFPSYGQWVPALFQLALQLVDDAGSLSVWVARNTSSTQFVPDLAKEDIIRIPLPWHDANPRCHR